MKIGLLARAEDRGIGIQTLGFYRHMRPHATVVVDMGPLARGFQPHFDRYSAQDSFVARFDRGQFAHYDAVLGMLATCDVVFAVETIYDWRLIGDLAGLGIPVVIQGNPEFHPHAIDSTVPHPAVWWWPTPWRLADIAPGPVVPVPVEETGQTAADPYEDGPLVVHHVVGHAAMADRNGTQALISAIRLVRRPMRIRIFTQDEQVSNVRAVPRHVSVSVETGGLVDRWDLYAGAHVVVQPRRYGGLHLPTQEAMAAGCAVAMTHCSPNEFWPTIAIPANRGPDMRTQGGRVPVFNPHPTLLARMLDRLASDRAEVALAQDLSRAWARTHSWPALRWEYETELDKALTSSLT